MCNLAVKIKWGKMEREKKSQDWSEKSHSSYIRHVNTHTHTYHPSLDFFNCSGGGV